MYSGNLTPTDSGEPVAVPVVKVVGLNPAVPTWASSRTGLAV
jgi:hypothetical protein